MIPNMKLSRVFDLISNVNLPNVIQWSLHATKSHEDNTLNSLVGEKNGFQAALLC